MATDIEPVWHTRQPFLPNFIRLKPSKLQLPTFCIWIVTKNTPKLTLYTHTKGIVMSAINSPQLLYIIRPSIVLHTIKNTQNKLLFFLFFFFYLNNDTHSKNNNKEYPTSHVVTDRRERERERAVSYTHLTLPTRRTV